MHLVEEEHLQVVDLYYRCKGGLGMFALPSAGGVLEQGAWIMAAFATIQTAEHELTKRQGART